MIFTLTEPGDDHALYVQEGLRAKGSDATLWFGTDLAQRMTASVAVDAAGIGFKALGPELDLALDLAAAGEPRTVWFRRPTRPVPPEGLHPADRTWARNENEEFHTWLFRALPRDAFWVNPYEAGRRSRSKLEQQRAARRVGLVVPPTLYSNDPEAIRAFVRAHGGDAIFKSYTQSGFWQVGSDMVAALFTARLTEEHLAHDEALRATPGIYQPRLDKAYELRVTVIGRRVFAARVNSQSMAEGRLDWRRNFEEMEGYFLPIELAPELHRAILRLMDEMGLIFGCLDFIVTPAGEHVFLEVNEMGQFLFIEEFAGIPLLDAFCEMLIQRTLDFTWDPERPAVRMADFSERVEERGAEMLTIHVASPEPILGFEEDGVVPEPAEAD